MKRIAAIVLTLYASTSGVAAQPKRPAEVPLDPYAEPPPAKADPKAGAPKAGAPKAGKSKQGKP